MPKQKKKQAFIWKIIIKILLCFFFIFDRVKQMCKCYKSPVLLNVIIVYDKFSNVFSTFFR